MECMLESATVSSYLHCASLSLHQISRCNYRIWGSYSVNNELSQSAMDNSFPVGIFVLSGLCQLEIFVVEMSPLFIMWCGVVWRSEQYS